MRIVIDMQGAQTDSRKRGIGRYTRGLAAALLANSNGHEIVLALNGMLPEGAAEVFSFFSGLIAPEYIRIWNGPDHSQFPVAPPSSARVEAESCYERFLLGLRPDVVILTTVLAEGSDANFTCALAELSRQTLVAAIAYDFLPLRHPERYLADPNQNALYRAKLKLLEDVGLFLAISEFTTKETRELFPSKEVVCIGTDTDVIFKPANLTKAEERNLCTRLGFTENFVFYAGGFARRKNIVALTRAYLMLPEALRRNRQLVLAVDKKLAMDENPELETLINEASALTPAEDRVIFTGRIDDHTLVSLYSICELFVFPSQEEGFGLPVLEAMRCGAPSIVANGTSLPEVMTWPEARFDPTDPMALSTLIARVVSNTDFMCQLRKHCEECQRSFSWDSIARRTLSALEMSVATKSFPVLPTETIPPLTAVPRSDSRYENIRQLFVDITNVAINDMKTGIQRVVRCVLSEMLRKPPVGFVVRPVYFSFDEGVFYHAHNYMWLKWLWDDTLKSDTPITFNPGDFFLRLDLNCLDPNSQQSNQLSIMHNTGVTIYTIVYDLIPVTHPQYSAVPKDIFENWLRMLTYCDGAICISRFVADELNLWLHRNAPERLVALDVSWFHLGSEIKTLQPSSGLPHDAETTLKQLHTAPTFLMVSTIEPRKGYALALEAFEQLWSEGENINLVFVGKQGWKMDAFCNRLREHPLKEKRFFWFHNANDAYLNRLYEAADAVIMASEVEGFGLAVVEAAHHHKNVILRDIPVFREIAEDHALYFEGNAADLAKTVRNWLSLNAKGMTPNTSAIRMLTWKQSTEMLLSRLPLRRPRRKKKPLTVLFSTWQAAFDCPGGGEIQLLRYEEHLKKQGIRVLRYNPWRPQFDEADIVHCFSVMGGSWNIPWYTRHNRHLPLVVSPIIWLDQPELYPVEEIKRILDCADHILPNSKAECTLLQKQFLLDSRLFTPIVNGVEEIFFEPIDPRLFRERFSLDEPFILCVGNIERRKNQLNLIRALRGTGLHLVLAGQEREVEYASLCHAEADQTVHFVGTLEHAGTLHRSAYAAADAFALTSTLETPGLAALEAAAAGCRLIITSGGCTVEYFGGFVTYCDPQCPENIRRAILAALEQPKTTALSEYVRTNFTWERAAEQLRAVYFDTLHSRRGAKAINPRTGHPRKKRTMLFVEHISLSSDNSLSQHMKSIFRTAFNVISCTLNGMPPTEISEELLPFRDTLFDFIVVFDMFPAPEALADLHSHRTVFVLVDAPVNGVREEDCFIWRNALYIAFDEHTYTTLTGLGLDVTQLSRKEVTTISTKASSKQTPLIQRLEHTPSCDSQHWNSFQTFMSWKHLLPAPSRLRRCTLEASGWNLVEPDGVWSAEQKSSLTLAVRPEEQLLILSLTPYLADAMPGSLLHITVNSNITASLYLTTSEEICLRLTPDRIKEGELRIELDMEKPLLSPKQLGIDDDARMLGVFLSNIKLTPLTSIEKLDCSFNDQFFFNLSGWWPFEGQGCWSARNQSSFTLFTTPGTKILELTCLTFLSRTVHLSVNGSSCGVFSVSGSHLMSVFLPAEVVDSGELRIELKIEETLLSPKELGHSEDTRILGIYLSHIKLSPFAPVRTLNDSFTSIVGQSTAFNLSGWRPCEGQGSWSAKNRSSFTLFTTPGAKMLELACSTFLARTVHLSVNGSLCGVFSVNGSLLISVSLPTEIVGTGELRIELEIEEMLLSPKELGMGEDPRKLGIFLSHIRLL